MMSDLTYLGSSCASTKNIKCHGVSGYTRILGCKVLSRGTHWLFLGLSTKLVCRNGLHVPGKPMDQDLETVFGKEEGSAS